MTIVATTAGLASPLTGIEHGVVEGLFSDFELTNVVSCRRPKVSVGLSPPHFALSGGRQPGESCFLPAYAKPLQPLPVPICIEELSLKRLPGEASEFRQGSRDRGLLGAFLCKYGKTTGFDCGHITSKTYTPSWVPNAAATFITARKEGVDMASGGDSGGPIFSSNAALGIVAGSVGSNNIDQVIYVAINYVEAGLSVKVTFPGQ